MKRQFPKTPIIGLTATATQDVIDDVIKMLGIPGALVFRAPLNRANLYYEVCFNYFSANCCDIYKLSKISHITPW
jgi:superfamily II DNA helicase RecQ